MTTFTHVDLTERALRNSYIEQRLSAPEIAKLYSCCVKSVYQKLSRFHIPRRSFSDSVAISHLKPSRKLAGAASSAWKGGRKKHSSGYILIHMPSHPAAMKDGYIYEHRLVLEASLMRPLSASEVCHHINGIKHDNRPENLQLLSFAEHAAHHCRINHANGLIPKPRNLSCLQRGIWSLRHSECVKCHTTCNQHHAHGLCGKCYDSIRSQAKKAFSSIE